MTRHCHPSEHDEAVILADWMRLRQIFFAHIPNEGRRSYRIAARMKAEGLTAGIPDYIILSHPRGSEEAEYDGVSPPVFLELKSKKGKLSRAQEEFIDRLSGEGYYTLVCYGADEAIDSLTKIGY